MIENELTIYEDKLLEMIEENDLEIEIFRSVFPVKIILQPREGNQTSFMERENIGGAIEFIFEDELIIKINDFKISDELLSRIKNRLKKWHYLYLQNFFKIRTGGQ